MIGGPGFGVRLALVLALLDPVVHLDHLVQRAVQDARTPASDRVMRSATDIGKPQILLGALLGIAVFSGPLGPHTARTALLALVPTNLVVEGTKRLVFRARPDGEHKRSNASFPSSHAANAFAIATLLATRWRRGQLAFLAGAVLVAYSRMHLNRHFLSDVLAGALIGVGCAVLAERWMRTRLPQPAAGADS